MSDVNQAKTDTTQASDAPIDKEVTAPVEPKVEEPKNKIKVRAFVNIAGLTPHEVGEVDGDDQVVKDNLRVGNLELVNE